MIDLAGLDAILAGLQQFRDDFAHHADLVAKLEKQRSDLADLKSISFGLETTVNRRKTDLQELETKIATANAKLEEIERAIKERQGYRLTVESEITGLRARLGL